MTGNKRKRHIRAEVTPGADSDAIKEDGERLIIHTKAPAKGGRANDAVCEMVREFVCGGECRVRIVSGHKRRQKILEIQPRNE